MPLPTSKTELLAALQQAYEKLDAEFDEIPSKHERTKGIEGNTSCCDILAYQIGWGKLLLNWEAQEKQNKTPAMPAEGYKWNQLGELAQSFYTEYANDNLVNLRNAYEELYQQLRSWINSLTDKELFEPHHRHWTGEKWAMVKWIQVNTIAPYRSARTKIRRWKREIATK